MDTFSPTVNRTVYIYIVASDSSVSSLQKKKAERGRSSCCSLALVESWASNQIQCWSVASPEHFGECQAQEAVMRLDVDSSPFGCQTLCSPEERHRARLKVKRTNAVTELLPRQHSSST